MSGRYLKKKTHNWWLITLLSVFVAICVFLAGIWISTLTVEQPSATVPQPSETVPATEAPATEPTQPPTEAETEAPTTEPTQPPTEETVPPTTEPPVEQQPLQLTTLLDAGGIRYEELAQNNCSQLITVVADGTNAQIGFYGCEEGVWEERTELACQGRVGRGGVSAEKQEGDGCTPIGLYGIGSAFYITDLPDTKLDMFQITDDTYWIDDPNSAFYNQKVEGTQNKDWDSAEYMISYGVYRYGFVVEYNLQAVKGAGSAIFFHVGNTPTAGCIATEENMVLAYLKELDKEKNPCILILDSDNV